MNKYWVYQHPYLLSYGRVWMECSYKIYLASRILGKLVAKGK